MQKINCLIEHISLVGSHCQSKWALSFQIQTQVHSGFVGASIQALDEGDYSHAWWSSMRFGSRSFHIDPAQLEKVFHTWQEQLPHEPSRKSLSISPQHDCHLFVTRAVYRHLSAPSICARCTRGCGVPGRAGQQSSWMNNHNVNLTSRSMYMMELIEPIHREKRSKTIPWRILRKKFWFAWHLTHECLSIRSFTVGDELIQGYTSLLILGQCDAKLYSSFI